MMHSQPRAVAFKDWLLAGWVGVVAGLFDGTATFLHPVSPVALPFAVLIYAFFNLTLFGLFLMGWRLLRRRDASLWALSLTFGFWIVFFAAYAATTSSAAWLATRKGALIGLVLAAAAGGAGWLVAMTVLRRIRARGSEQGHDAAGRRAAGRGVYGWDVMLLLVLLIYPVQFGVFKLSHGQASTSSGAPRGFILISLDAARGDRISALGYDRPTTPRIDDLIRTGTAFSRAYVQHPASGPGHACMLTGLPSLSHGLVANSHTLSDSVITLAERLRDAGFHTAAFIDNFYLESRFGFAQGFDCFINEYRATRLDNPNPLLLLRGLSLFHVYKRVFFPPARRNTDTIREAFSWLRNRPAGDFFVFLHIMDPHSPYDPPSDLRAKFYQPTGPPVHDTEALRRRMKSLSNEEISALRDLYDGDMAFADRQVGWLVAELVRLHLLDSTLLVVTADHGEVLYEKDKVFDHGLIWDGNLHVPLVFHYPQHAPAGLIVDTPVAATALVPTALYLLDIPYLDQTGTGFFRSLLQKNGPAPQPEPACVHSLSGITEADAAALTCERYKLILRRGGSMEFYDLLNDPQEQDDLWPGIEAFPGSELSQLVDRMQADLRTWLQASAEAAVGLQDQGNAAIDRETARRLRALGY
jgi:arylsulfatase A-like enzyme